MKEKKNRGVKRDWRRGERGPWGRERERECVGGNETGQGKGDGKKGSVERQSQKLSHFLR